ncbi:hypothetical protein H0W80_04585 [Candidatus Saccharibacteria bacterium]|nr:hypothetical protein [Candidatus Saccharibacteria bacterium]
MPNPVKAKPYVGITGFMNYLQVEEVLRVLPEEPKFQLMVGVLVSDKTLVGQTNNHPNEFPPIHRVSEIFHPDSRVLNLVHYNTHNTLSLPGQMADIKIYAGSNCQGFQLNIDWPSIDDLARFRRRYPRLVIVQQISATVMAETTPEQLARRISSEYSDLIDHVLLDGSGGFGKPLHLGLCEDYIGALLAHNLHKKIGIGIAGGLCAESLSRLAPLFRAYPKLNIDAQGRLRTTDKTTLDMQRCIEYVQVALTLPY